MDEETVYVQWYQHDCPWITKYCDEYHKVGAQVPVSILNDYKKWGTSNDHD